MHFPLFSKISVLGEDQHPLYAALSGHSNRVTDIATIVGQITYQQSVAIATGRFADQRAGASD